jgi:hypothetical protein
MRLRNRLPILLSLAALVALALAGCGGGGDGTTDTTAAKPPEETPALSKTELISQGDAICAEVNSAVGSVGSSAADPSTASEQVATLYSNMIASLEGLGAPKEKSTEYDEFAAAADELAKATGEVKLAAEREDQVALGEAESNASAALEAFQSAATAYGFQQCGEAPSAPTGPTTGGEPGEEGGIEASPEEVEEIAPEEVPEEMVPEEGGGAGVEEPPAEEGGGGGNSGGVGPG